MAIAAPVDYWEKKRIKHRNLYMGSGTAVIVGMIATGAFLSNKMQAVQETLAKLPAITQPQGTSSVHATTSVLPTTSPASVSWELGIFIMLAVLCFWVLRILVRIFLSNLHLENDAAERVTMAKTYLALIRSNSLSKEENINTVLAALFRPTGDGIVKDEGLPPSMMEFLTKLNR